MINWLPNRGSRRRATSGCSLIVAAVATALVAAGVNGSPEDSMRRSASPRLPDVIVVRVHADWCGACKKLAPVYSELKGRTNDQAILYLTLDMTDDATRRQAEYLAGVLGIDRLWLEQGRKVGSVVLIDGKRKRVVSTMGAPYDVKSIEAAVRKAVDSSRNGS